MTARKADQAEQRSHHPHSCPPRRVAEDRRRSRSKPRAIVRVPAHPVDLDRSGLQGPVSIRRRVRGQGSVRHRFKTSIRPTEGHPIVVGKGGPQVDGQAPRVLFYGHYDVQPVDPLDLWEAPPFAPRIATLPDGRKIIVARGACDDKGQVMTFIEACRAFTAVTGELPLPITMMIEGEEECGSNHLFGFVKDNAAELKL